MEIRQDEPLGRAIVDAIRRGNLGAVTQLLTDHPGLARARIGGEPNTRQAGNTGRTLLHVATDWPGHFPNTPATIAALIDGGADVNAAFVGSHAETPLHWAASSDDVEAIDVLLDNGANIEAPGSVLGGGSPLADAVGFGQWNAARRLIERGARSTLWQSAALGLMDRVKNAFAGSHSPNVQEVTEAFWSGCHGGQRESAAYLLEHGADINWVGYDRLMPLDAALRSGHTDLGEWLRTQGGRSASDRQQSSG